MCRCVWFIKICVDMLYSFVVFMSLIVVFMWFFMSCVYICVIFSCFMHCVHIVVDVLCLRVLFACFVHVSWSCVVLIRGVVLFRCEERTAIRIKVLDVLCNILGTFSPLYEVWNFVFCIVCHYILVDKI